MFDAIASPAGLIVLIGYFALGAVGAVVLRKRDALANLWSGCFAIVGSLWGLFFALAALGAPNPVAFTADGSAFPLLSVAFSVDRLSAFFVFTISLIALFCSIYGIGYVRHFYGKYNIGALGFFYNLFIAGMLLVVTASNAIFFLIAWEIMSVASYFLVVYERDNPDSVKAGFLYLVMTHIGTAFIILAFLLLYRFTGSLDFGAIKSGAVSLPVAIKDIVFILAVIGFGTKAGIIPFHIWLPSAHPAAPSHVSGLMSGVMIKTGIFMMIRIFLDLLQPTPAWWGLALLVIGSVSSVLGVLYALTEHDIKRLLAYHSIENIGIILLGLGSALTFTSLGLPSLALLALTASLFHTLNHAVFKSLLFLGAGSVINETHTRNMEEYGGLIRYMPETALFFLVGAMAISALPPFNGFFSEWLTYQSLFQGILVLNTSAKWIFIAAAGALALTGGLALACFVKAFGATFLARPRGEEVRHARESAFSLRLGMGVLATIALLLGIFSGSATAAISEVGRGLTAFNDITSFAAVSAGQTISAGTFSSVAAPRLAALLLAAFLIALIGAGYLVNRRQKIRVGATWDCGTDLSPRMEITATGFARSIIMIFRGVLKPSIQYDVEYHDERSRYLPQSRTVTMGIGDFYKKYLYGPLSLPVALISARIKVLQGGNISVYILYILTALLVALFFTR